MKTPERNLNFHSFVSRGMKMRMFNQQQDLIIFTSVERLRSYDYEMLNFLYTFFSLFCVITTLLHNNLFRRRIRLALFWHLPFVPSSLIDVMFGPSRVHCCCTCRRESVREPP